MAMGGTSVLIFRIESALRGAGHTVAEHEHRSIANIVDVMLWDYCGRNGIVTPERQLLFDEGRKSPYWDR